jgi:signal transduction histidine kinase
MASYLGIIFIAGLLLDTWAALAFGVLSIGFTWLLLYGDGQPWLPAAAPYITVNTFWSEFSAVVIGVVGLLALTMNSLHSALNRARRNERELAEKMVEVEKLAREAQEADLFKTRLIARVGHELRTPLGAISGMTEILQQGSHGSLNGKQNELVDRILVNCQTLNTTFSELLEQADIHARNIEVKQESFSPAKLLDRIEDGFGKLAEQKGLEFYLHIAPDLPSQLVGDPGKIEQILINLILNAIKFTEKGSIAVALDRLDPGEWTVRVTDSGIGIPEDQQEKIFEPFRQVDESRTRKYGGLGLGLTIVRQLVTAMNGHVTLESKPGRGTAITVTLPLVEPIIEAAQ